VKKETVTCPFGNKIVKGNADDIQSRLMVHFQEELPRTIIFDMQHVSVCDSYGLRILLSFRRKAIAMKKTLLIYRPHNTLRQTLEMTNLIHMFTVSDNLPVES